MYIISNSLPGPDEAGVGYGSSLLNVNKRYCVCDYVGMMWVYRTSLCIYTCVQKL